MSTESTTTPREGRENHENYYNFSHHSRTANVIYKSPICDECQSQSARFCVLHRLEGCDSNLRENLAKKHIKVTTILCNDIVEEKKNVARLSYSTEEKESI